MAHSAGCSISPGLPVAVVISCLKTRGEPADNHTAPGLDAPRNRVESDTGPSREREVDSTERKKRAIAL